MNLIKHFTALYTQPIFRIESIEYKNSAIPTVRFLNTKTRKLVSKSLESLFNDKSLLKQFSSKDASKIGYTYGTILVKQNAINNTN